MKKVAIRKTQFKICWPQRLSILKDFWSGPELWHCTINFIHIFFHFCQTKKLSKFYYWNFQSLYEPIGEVKIEAIWKSWDTKLWGAKCVFCNFGKGTLIYLTNPSEHHTEMEQLFSLPCLYLQTKCVYLLWYYREISNKQLLQKRNPFAHLPPYGSQYKHNIQHIVYSHTYYSLKGAIMLENNSFAFLAYATAYAKKPLPCDNRLATSGLKCSTFMHGFNYAESNICWHVNRCYTKGARLETFYDLWEMETPTLCPINDEA